MVSRAHIPPTNAGEWFYDFVLDGEKRGYSYLRIDEDELLSVTRFRLPDESIYVNRFEVRCENGRPVACRRGDGPWFDVPSGQFPGSAYELLLGGVGDSPVHYQQLSEEDGSVVAATLERQDDVIVESGDGRATRRFHRRNGVTVSVDWGGAMSTLHESGEAAAAGSGVPFSVE